MFLDDHPKLHYNAFMYQNNPFYKNIINKVQEELESYEDELFDDNLFGSEDLNIYCNMPYNTVRQIIEKYLEMSLFHSSRFSISSYSVKWFLEKDGVEWRIASSHTVCPTDGIYLSVLSFHKYHCRQSFLLYLCKLV